VDRDRALVEAECHVEGGDAVERAGARRGVGALRRGRDRVEVRRRDAVRGRPCPRGPEHLTRGEAALGGAGYTLARARGRDAREVLAVALVAPQVEGVPRRAVDRDPAGYALEVRGGVDPRPPRLRHLRHADAEEDVDAVTVEQRLEALAAAALAPPESGVVG